MVWQNRQNTNSVSITSKLKLSCNPTTI
uniref:Uncharacterized protein n=1 Tax=Anguilla anguilla TaxID=7936 RepID=A0A0E9UEP8_ANGAN